LGFNQFQDPNKFHWEFQCLEVTTHEPLTDKQVLHFYELKKLPPLNSNDSGRDLWLKLFRAETEEELKEIEKLGVPIMSEALQAYRHVTASDKFIQLEKAISKARHDEAQALSNAEQRGAENERQKWQVVMAEKDATIANRDAVLANKDAAIASKDAENEQLRSQLAKLRLQFKSLDRQE